MYCIKCGAKNEEHAKFCEKCGVPMNTNADSGENSAAVQQDKNNNGQAQKKERKKFVVSGCVMLSVVVLFIGILIYNGYLESLNVVGNTNFNIANGAFIAQDGDWIYYAQTNDVTTDASDDVCGTDLYKSRKNGSQVQRLTEDEPHIISSIFVTDGWVYFVKEGDGIWRMSADGMGEERLCDGESIVGIIKDELYFWVKDDADDGTTATKELYRSKTDGTQCKKMEEMWGSDFASIKDGYIYYDQTGYIGEHGGDQIYKKGINKISRLGTLITSEDEDTYVSKLCFSEDGLYYLRCSDSDTENKLTLHFIPKNENGNKDQELLSDIGYCYYVQGNIVYTILEESDSGEYGLYSIDLDTGVKTKLCEYNGWDMGLFSGVNIIDDWIFFTEDSSNGEDKVQRILWKIKDDGTEKQKVI